MSAEVEKIMDLAEAFAGIYSEAIHEHYVHNQSHQGLAPMRDELRAAVEALVAERDRLSTELDLVSWSFGETPPDAIAKARAKAQVQQKPRLDKPAMVGPFRFHAGVPQALVIRAAQWQYEKEVTPEKEAQRIAEAQKKVVEFHGQVQRQQPCEECNGTGKVSGSQATFDFPKCSKAVAQVQQEPVGTAVELPAAPAWTTACFESAKVPVGAKIYAAPVNDKLREAVQKALELARDGAIESLIEVLEAVK